MTMAAVSVSLDHHARGASTYDDPVIGINAKGEANLRVDGTDGRSMTRESTSGEGEDSEEEAEEEAEVDGGEDGEEDDEEGDPPLSVSKPSVRKNPRKAAESVLMEDEEEDGEDSSSAEADQDSEESDSDSESEDAPDYDELSEAAETAASAEVQTRNNCM